MAVEESSSEPVARLVDVDLRYGNILALNGITLDIPARTHGRFDRPGRSR